MLYGGAIQYGAGMLYPTSLEQTMEKSNSLSPKENNEVIIARNGLSGVVSVSYTYSCRIFIKDSSQQGMPSSRTKVDFPLNANKSCQNCPLSSM